jgi:hypothetical protein
MRATAKYFFVVTALFLGQVLLGIVTAHYAVEGQGLYGLPMAGYFPYAITRTWHTQLAVLWIATAWLATGLYVAPILGGREPRFQRFGVNFLFVSLLVIVVGSFAGEWAAINRHITGGTPLVRPPGWHIWTRPLSGLSVHRPVAGTSWCCAGLPRAAERAGAQGFPGGDRDGLDRPAVRDRVLRRAHPHLHNGVLALVGRSPLGRRH